MSALSGNFSTNPQSRQSRPSSRRAQPKYLRQTMVRGPLRQPGISGIYLLFSLARPRAARVASSAAPGRTTIRYRDARFSPLSFSITCFRTRRFPFTPFLSLLSLRVFHRSLAEVSIAPCSVVLLLRLFSFLVSL